MSGKVRAMRSFTRRSAALRAEPVALSQAKPAAAIARKDRLTQLYLAGMPFRLIAREYGGTEQGIRSTVRKMRERGALPDRPQPQRGQW